jgi:hypothetical protein
MKILDLQKVFSTNVEYKAQANAFFVFNSLGTDVDIDSIEIEGRKTTPLDSTLAPQVRTASNLFGPEDLEDLYLVVPPNHRFKFNSSSSGKVVVYGKMGLLALGEGLPADLVNRFNNINYSYKKPITFTKTLDVNQSIPADGEVVIGTLTPSNIERYIFDDIIGFSGTNIGTLAPGKIAIRFYYDDTPLDIIDKTMGHFGIDAYEMPLPPTTTTDMDAYWLRENPIVVEPNHTLKITAVNISGSAITPPSGQSITLTVKALARYNVIG